MKDRFSYSWIVAVGLAILCGRYSLTRADDDSHRLQQRREIEAQFYKDNAELGDIRRELAKSDDIAAAAKALAETKKKLEEQITTNPKIEAARKAATDADKLARETADAASAASPEVAAAQQEFSKADDAAFDVQSQLRIAQFTLGEWRRKMARLPEMKKLFDDLASADMAIRDAKSSRVAKAIADAKGAKDAAQKTYDDGLDAKVGANAEAAEVIKRIQELEGQAAQGQAGLKALSQKLHDAREKAVATDPKALQAQNAAQAAIAAFRATGVQELASARAAEAAAQKDYDDKLEAKVDADPRSAPLKKEIADLVRQSHILADSVRMASPAASAPAVFPASIATQPTN